MNTLTLRRERVEHANDLIKVIAAHGRRFFYNEKHDRVAHLEVDDRSRVWFVDDYSGKRIYTHATGFTSRWRGFTHGGTLRSLVECMRDYIVHGTPVPRWRIVTQQLGRPDENIWGYGKEAADATRAAALVLPIIEVRRDEVTA